MTAMAVVSKNSPLSEFLANFIRGNVVPSVLKYLQPAVSSWRTCLLCYIFVGTLFPAYFSLGIALSEYALSYGCNRRCSEGISRESRLALVEST